MLGKPSAESPPHLVGREDSEWGRFQSTEMEVSRLLCLMHKAQVEPVLSESAQWPRATGLATSSLDRSDHTKHPSVFLYVRLTGTYHWVPRM